MHISKHLPHLSLLLDFVFMATRALFSKFTLQNVLNFNNTKLWPVKNSSVAHRLRNPALSISGWISSQLAAFLVRICSRIKTYLEARWIELAIGEVTIYRNEFFQSELSDTTILYRTATRGDNRAVAPLPEIFKNIVKAPIRFSVVGYNNKS